MDFAKHELLFSPDRLNTYMKAAEDNQQRALQFYKLNIQASQALYPLISILEVSLRNAIDRELVKHFRVADWLLTQRTGFANHVNMVRKDEKGNVVADHFFTEKLQKAENKLAFHNVGLTHGRLLAELTFGFWVKFFDSNAIKILKGVPLQAFKNKPSIKLAAVHSHLNSIVAVRNRISHNEPICFGKNRKLCLTTLQAYETDIISALGWIDSDLKSWAEKMNFFQPVLNRIASV